MMNQTSNQDEAFVLIQEIRVKLERLQVLLEDEESEDFLKIDLQKIMWNKEGVCEFAVEQDSRTFRTLINILDSHNGQIQIGDYFFWKLPTKNTIIRKLIDTTCGVLI